MQPGMVVSHTYAGECIVAERAPVPDAAWLAAQQDERSRDLPGDVHWWMLLRIGGGAVLAAEPLVQTLRAATYDDFLRAVDHANVHGRRSLAALFPEFTATALAAASSKTEEK